MTKIVIDQRLKALIPNHSSDEREGLKRSIMKEGRCLDKLKVWAHDGITTLLDGHTRYDICMETGIPLPDCEAIEAVKTFEDAWNWVIDWAIGQRNLTPMHIAYLLGKKLAAEKKPEGGDKKSEEYKKSLPHSEAVIRTSEKIAKANKVGHCTVERNQKLAQSMDKIRAVSPSTADKILNEEIEISRPRINIIANEPGVSEQGEEAVRERVGRAEDQRQRSQGDERISKNGERGRRTH